MLLLGVSVASVATVLRFWQLGRFNTLVFDEVYFAQFAQQYLAGTPGFDAHPPLGKYLIAGSLWISDRSLTLLQRSPISQSALVEALGVSSISYRWINAMVGSLLPLLVVGLCYQLTGSRSQSGQDPSVRLCRRSAFAMLAGLFIATDGLFVTESRYALLNVHMIFLGLLAHWLWFQANLIDLPGPDRRRRQWAYRVLSAAALGGAIATKWNGLGYWVSLLLWEGGRWQQIKGRKRKRQQCINLFVFLGAVPLIVYGLCWWPHLHLTGDRFLEVHHTLLQFHTRLDVAQRNCSSWYSWPLLIKPMTYWYQKVGDQVFTVNNLGNPVLWMFSGAAIALLTIDRLATDRFWQRIWLLSPFAQSKVTTRNAERLPALPEVETYVLLGYFANWLPWMLVSRCTYLYLYMPAAAYSFVAFAWLLSGWLQRQSPYWVRLTGWLMLSAIALAAVFWLPLSIGSPLSLESLQTRWWLKSWL